MNPSTILNGVGSALNKDPQAVNALSVTSSSPIIIVIRNDIMQISGYGNFELCAYTTESLANAINSLGGLTATVIQYGSLSALALIEGTYSTNTIIPVATSPLWTYGIAIELQMKIALDNEANSVFQAVPQTSSGTWLDSLGIFYGVLRQAGEPDPLYAIRIFDFSLGVRVNNVAIQKVLADLGYQSTVTDTTPSPAFEVRITLPTSSPQGYVYSIASLSDMIDILKAAGVPATVVLDSSFQDTVHITDTVSQTLTSKTWTWGSFVWGAFNWQKEGSCANSFWHKNTGQCEGYFNR